MSADYIWIRLHILHHAVEGPIFGLEMAEELARHGYRIIAEDYRRCSFCNTCFTVHLRLDRFDVAIRQCTRYGQIKL
jgi:hypothetical protein